MDTGYKKSIFNLLFKGSKKNLLYNTFSTGLLELDDPSIIKVFSDMNNDCLDSIPSDGLQILKNNGFIVEKGVDEIDKIRFRYRKGAYDNQSFAVQLLPTTGCNFVCPYCFEQSKVPEKMDANDCTEIEKFIDKHLRVSRPQEMQLGWYGGEPLLCVDTIERITAFVNESRRINGVRETGKTYIVTNGYLLDEGVARRLSNCGIGSVQITIDGGRKEHDSQRYLADGTGTYDRVLKAAYVASDHFDEVIIRFNINRKNWQSVSRLIDNEALFHKKNVTIFPGYLKSYLSGNKTKAEDLNLFSGAEFRVIQEELLRRNNKDFREDLLSFPAKLNNCTADTYHGFNIGPGCKVYKCLERIEPGEAVGVIEDGEFKENHKYWPWLMDEPFKKEVCTQCVYLPMCMGGCPSLRREIGVPNNETCEFWKEYLSGKFTAIDKSMD